MQRENNLSFFDNNYQNLPSSEKFLIGLKRKRSEEKNNSKETYPLVTENKTTYYPPISSVSIGDIRKDIQKQLEKNRKDTYLSSLITENKTTDNYPPISSVSLGDIRKDIQRDYFKDATLY